MCFVVPYVTPCCRSSFTTHFLQTVDSYIPEPERDVEKPFLMPVEDVFSIAGRGTVATGRVEQGVLNIGDELDLIGYKAPTKTTCTGVEMFKKQLDRGQVCGLYGSVAAMLMLVCCVECGATHLFRAHLCVESMQRLPGWRQHWCPPPWCEAR